MCLAYLSRKRQIDDCLSFASASSGVFTKAPHGIETRNWWINLMCFPFSSSFCSNENMKENRNGKCFNFIFLFALSSRRRIESDNQNLITTISLLWWFCSLPMICFIASLRSPSKFMNYRIILMARLEPRRWFVVMEMASRRSSAWSVKLLGDILAKPVRQAVELRLFIND